MGYSSKPAIVLVGYNRIDCISRLLDSVNEAYYPSEDIHLIVSLDRSDVTSDIIKQVKRIGFCHGTMDIRTYPKRLGLKDHILKCGDMTEEFGAVIILEDDLVVARSFYEYVCKALDYYHDEDAIAGISLYSHAWNGYSNYQFLPQKNQYDTYLGQFSITWGQCWTREHWKRFRAWYMEHQKFVVPNYNVPEQIEYFGDQSWGRYYACYVVDTDRYYVIPYTSLSTNYSEAGVHGAAMNTAHQVMLLYADRDYEYRFAPMDKAIKYDMFFERVLRNTIIAGINSNDICFDLNAQHRQVNGFKYVLTMEHHDELELVASYAVMLRPIEENVIKGIDGDDIFLYKLPYDGYELIRDVENHTRIHYELYNHWKERLLPYSKEEYRKSYLVKVEKRINRVKDKIAHKQSEMVNARIERRNSQKPRFTNGHVLMFHDISDMGGELTISLERFEEILDVHKKKGYSFISLDDLENVDDFEQKCIVTFDDGYKSTLDCVPYLNDNNIPFCVYVIPSKIGDAGYLSEEDLKMLSANTLCTIGNHTMNHIMARKSDKKKLEQEVRKANVYLENITGKKVVHFAFPYGSPYAVTAGNIKLISKLSLFKTIALTLHEDLKASGTKPMIIGRYDATRDDILDIL